jgi:disulfide bond formation protein DsbB
MPELTVDLVERFYAILAIAALGGMVILATLRILAIQSDPALDAYAAIARAIQARGVIAAWFVAALASVGSLFFSEVAKFTPCTLCWYQRIAMYPLALILGIAAWRDDTGVRTYAIPLAAIGAVVSTYHIALQRLPGLPSGACSLDAPCSAIELERFGFVTIPVMALIGFASIIVVLTLLTARRSQTS